MIKEIAKELPICGNCKGLAFCPYDVKGVCFFTEELSIKYKKNCLEDEFNSCVYWAPNQMQMKVPSTSGNRSRGRAEHTL